MHKLLHLLILLLTATVLYACTSNEERKPSGEMATGEAIDSLDALQEEPNRKQTETRDTVEFNTAFEEFFEALQASDTATLNKLIDPAYGLWVIEQLGAMPKMTQVTNITTFKREYQDRPFITVWEEMKECDLNAEPWPAFDCGDMNYEAGKSGYSKDGCFVAGPGRFRKSGYWNYAELPEADIRKIERTLPLVQKSVLHTGTSFEFHFGYRDKQWKLLFAKLIYPCSA